MFSCEHCKIFKNIYFEKHLQTASFEIEWKCFLIMKYYHSELVMKNVFHVHFNKQLNWHICR